MKNFKIIYASIVVFMVSVIILAIIDIGIIEADVDFLVFIGAALVLSVFVGLGSFAVALKTNVFNEEDEENYN